MHVISCDTSQHHLDANNDSHSKGGRFRNCPDLNRASGVRVCILCIHAYTTWIRQYDTSLQCLFVRNFELFEFCMFAYLCMFDHFWASRVVVMVWCYLATLLFPTSHTFLSLQRNKRLFIPHPVFQHWSFQHQSECRLKVLSAVRLQTIQLQSHDLNFMHGIPRSRQGERRFSNVWGQHNVTPSTWALSIYCSNYSLIIVCGHIKAPACNVDAQNSTSPLKEWTIQFNPIYIELETSKLRWCRKSTEHSCPAQVASAACRLLEDLFLLRSWHLSTTPCGLLRSVPACG